MALMYNWDIYIYIKVRKTSGEEETEAYANATNVHLLNWVDQKSLLGRELGKKFWTKNDYKLDKIKK
jgi:hypothetical protein